MSGGGRVLEHGPTVETVTEPGFLELLAPLAKPVLPGFILDDGNNFRCIVLNKLEIIIKCLMFR